MSNVLIKIEEKKLEMDAYAHILSGLEILETLNENDINYRAEIRASIEDYSEALKDAGEDLLELQPPNMQ